jgi:hypothetical protein
VDVIEDGADVRLRVNGLANLVREFAGASDRRRAA